MQPNQYKSKKFKRFIVKSIKLIILLAVIYAIAVVYSRYNPTIKVSTITIDTSKEQFAQKVDSLEKSIVEQVRKCESQGYKEADGLIVFDSNKVASIGTMQFQKATVIAYYKKLYNKTITGKEAILIALDDKLAGELAQDIMFKSNSLANDWYNCSNKLSLSAQITAIKAIK